MYLYNQRMGWGGGGQKQRTLAISGAAVLWAGQGPGEHRVRRCLGVCMGATPLRISLAGQDWTSGWSSRPTRGERGDGQGTPRAGRWGVRDAGDKGGSPRIP